MVAVRKYRSSWATMAAAMCLGSQIVDAIDLDLSSQDSIKSAAGSVAQGLMASYDGNEEGNTPGMLPDPYFWWEAGGMFGAMVDYWHYTGDSSYNDVVKQALLYQAGDDDTAFMPANQTRTEGNDDHATWGLAALSAAEFSFPSPPSGDRQWLDLAQSVFDALAMRWDVDTCGGGLRWQIFPYNNGYQYKDALTNGAFFNLASRLARYTGNDTYADWAGKTWDWTNKVGLMDSKFRVFDGTDVNGKCEAVNHIQWSISLSHYLSGAASMYNSTDGGTKWKNRVDGLLKSTDVFFNNDILTETACEKMDTCNIDQKSFKSFLARDLAATIKMAPYTQDAITKRLSISAKAAAKGCVKGGNGNDDDGGDSMALCPLNWNKPAKGTPKNNVGTQMNALQVIQANLVGQASAPVTAETAGNSSSTDPSGTNPSGTGSPTSTASGGATSTGAAPQLSAQQILLASPVISLIFGYFL